jgi:hypothetical protein
VERGLVPRLVDLGAGVGAVEGEAEEDAGGGTAPRARPRTASGSAAPLGLAATGPCPGLGASEGSIGRVQAIRAVAPTAVRASAIEADRVEERMSGLI